MFQKNDQYLLEYYRENNLFEEKPRHQSRHEEVQHNDVTNEHKIPYLQASQQYHADASYQKRKKKQKHDSEGPTHQEALLKKEAFDTSPEHIL